MLRTHGSTKGPAIRSQERIRDAALSECGSAIRNSIRLKAEIGWRPPEKHKLIGAKIATSSRPRDQQAVRRPELAIRLCSRGRIVTEPVAFLDCSRHG